MWTIKGGGGNGRARSSETGQLDYDLLDRGCLGAYDFGFGHAFQRGRGRALYRASRFASQANHLVGPILPDRSLRSLHEFGLA